MTEGTECNKAKTNQTIFLQIVLEDFQNENRIRKFMRILIGRNLVKAT